MKPNEEKRGRHAPHAGDWISLAAAPTFAIMALLTGVVGDGAMCSPLGGAWSVSGMVPMYLLMSAFHSPPWLKLISSRRRGARRAAVSMMEIMN